MSTRTATRSSGKLHCTLSPYGPTSTAVSGHVSSTASEPTQCSPVGGESDPWVSNSVSCRVRSKGGGERVGMGMGNVCGDE